MPVDTLQSMFEEPSSWSNATQKRPALASGTMMGSSFSSETRTQQEPDLRSALTKMSFESTCRPHAPYVHVRRAPESGVPRRTCPRRRQPSRPHTVQTRAYIELLLVVAARVLLAVHAEEARNARLRARARGGLAREAELRHQHGELQVLGVRHEPEGTGVVRNCRTRPFVRRRTTEVAV